MADEDQGEMSGKFADELARITGADKQQAATAQIGLMLFSHYKALLDAGFSKVEALHLTANYQTALVAAQSAALERERDS